MLFAGSDCLWIGGGGVLGRGACALGLGGWVEAKECDFVGNYSGI
jgi:hypothetical protein